MSVQSEALKERTLCFSLRALKVIEALPGTVSGQVVGRQLAKSATSIGANYRAACSARSSAEFVAKLGIVFEECDEAVYWLDVIRRANLMARDTSDILGPAQEASELRAIFATSLRTAREHLRQRSKTHGTQITK
jgi:four helix bundle protein